MLAGPVPSIGKSAKGKDKGWSRNGANNPPKKMRSQGNNRWGKGKKC